MTSTSQGIKLLLTEDLSPHKIALLFLVVLYSTGLFPENRLKQVLLALIKLLENEPLCNDDNEFIIVPRLTDLCAGLRKAMISGQTPKDKDEVEKDIIDLQRKLLQALWNINSVESLDTYMKNTFSLLLNPLAITVPETSHSTVKKLISPRSFIGDFIQKIVTTFRLLHFDEEFLLYEALVEYRESSRELFLSLGGEINHHIKSNSKPSPRRSRLDFSHERGKDLNEVSESDDILFSKLNDQLAESLDISIPTPSQAITELNVKLIPVPKHDMQALLDKQVNLLETYGTETPEFLRKIMSMMASPNSNTCMIQNANFNNLPSYYYLRYLENLHENDYHGAFQCLHQYFDYMVSKSSKYFYHFALISRASLHQYFGEDEKALDAIEEAISVARENKDNSTLTYILSWLFNFIRNKPDLWKSQNFYQNNNELHLLDFLIKKSQTVSLLLYAMSYNFETAHMMNSCAPMNKYLESLLKATYISINDELPTFIKSAEMASTVWTRIGNPHLSQIYANLALDCAQEIGKLGDELSIEIRKNYLTYLEGSTDDAYHNLEKLKVRAKKDRSLFKSVQIRSLIMLVKIDLKKGRLKYAERLMETLLSIDIQDMELKMELIYLNTEVQAALGNFSKALEIISNSLLELNNQQMRIQTNSHTIIRLNLLKCSIFNRAGAQSRAISLVIQQVQLGKKLGFTTITTEGMILLVSILNNMDAYEDAYDILNNYMPTILSVNNEEFICTAYYEFAKSCYKMVQKETNKHNIPKKTLFNIFLKYLLLSITSSKRSLNLVLLRKCFELEGKMGKECASFAGEMKELQSLDDFREHSKTGLVILNNRAIQEADYGFIINHENPTKAVVQSLRSMDTI